LKYRGQIKFEAMPTFALIVSQPLSGLVSFCWTSAATCKSNCRKNSSFLVALWQATSMVRGWGDEGKLTGKRSGKE
jgi:apolipoprotein N-acyltransferase